MALNIPFSSKNVHLTQNLYVSKKCEPDEWFIRISIIEIYLKSGLSATKRTSIPFQEK